LIVPSTRQYKPITICLMKTEQIYTALAVCKGKAVSEIKMLMSMWGEDSIADLAKFFQCGNTTDAVAECLSKGLSAVRNEEKTEESPAENEESVAEDTADSENGILSEETDGESTDSEEETEDSADSKTEDKKDKKDKKDGKDKPKEKKETYKPNLPTGFSFNPLVIAIKPFYEQAIAEDELFAQEVKEKESRKEKPKSLAECAEYIVGEAYKYAKEHQSNGFGLAGFPDEMMPTLIKHYYDEDDIKIERFNDAKVATAPSKPFVPPTIKKGKDAPPKPKNNVIDITKSITAKPKAEEGKKPKHEKKKDNLKAGFVPMERPNLENYEKEGKKGSREQAKSVEQMDLFAGFFD